MPRLKTQVIVNPASNQGRTRKRWRQIKEALRAFLKEFKTEFTEKPMQAAEISRSAIKDGTELIVGVGGDGTMNEIANGFYENRKIINSEAILGILPSGTGCDFSRGLHIPSGFRRAMEIITRPVTHKIDVGRISFLNYKNKQEERFFLNISDFGIGGEVVQHMRIHQMKHKKASYLKSVITTFMNYKAKKLRIRIDGKEIPPDDYMIGAVANGPIFGKGMKIAPEAALDDGLFDFILVKKMAKWEFFRNLIKLYRGTHLSHPKVSFFRGKKIEASSASDKKKVLIEVDGEQVGMLPVSFEIIPLSISVKGSL